MEVHVTGELEVKLTHSAAAQGCNPDELAHTREMLDRRFDEMEKGKVRPIDGEEAYRRLMEKTEAQRGRRPA
jgi:hypothetical protein